VNPWTANRRQTLADDLDMLLGALCATWGFCNRLRSSELLEGRSTLTADGFAEAVLVAEQLDPRINADWRRKIRRVFVARYGQSTVSAQDDFAGGPA
jgi:hypothetical protein